MFVAAAAEKEVKPDAKAAPVTSDPSGSKDNDSPESPFKLIPKTTKQMSFSESEIDRRRSLSESEEVSPQSDLDDNTYQKVLASTKPIPIK